MRSPGRRLRTSTRTLSPRRRRPGPPEGMAIAARRRSPMRIQGANGCRESRIRPCSSGISTSPGASRIYEKTAPAGGRAERARGSPRTSARRGRRRSARRRLAAPLGEAASCRRNSRFDLVEPGRSRPARRSRRPRAKKGKGSGKGRSAAISRRRVRAPPSFTSSLSRRRSRTIRARSAAAATATRAAPNPGSCRARSGQRRWRTRLRSW